MASFGGTTGIEELEAMAARTVDRAFLDMGPEALISWMEGEGVRPAAWWDYSSAKLENPEAVFVPFNHFGRIMDRGQGSMSYLRMSRETALKIVLLGHVPTL